MFLYAARLVHFIMNHLLSENRFVFPGCLNEDGLVCKMCVSLTVHSL